jgi:hypothetical protein
MRQLELICQTVHPSEHTFNAFGQASEIFLFSPGTEVETHWRGILVANNFIKGQYSTNHYVLLQDAMWLGDYAIEFPYFPWLAPVRPFEGWGASGKPTQELGWYAAYNAVKHNREHEFSRATLRNVFEAVSACVIMMVAQFYRRPWSRHGISVLFSLVVLATLAFVTCLSDTFRSDK